MRIVEGAHGSCAVFGPEVNITSVEQVLDLMVEARYVGGCVGMILEEGSLGADFFKLSTGLAGEILQKFSNYRFRLAIVGDFSRYASQSLRDFRHECNTGGLVSFVSTVEEGIQRILGA